MVRRAYTDFDITLRAVGAEYEAQVTIGDRSATNRFPLPFAERELDDFYSMFGGRRVRRMESPQLERTRAFGGRLYRAVFNDELDELLAASLNQAGEQGNGLRIRLRFDDAPDLVNIPWEYLYRPASDDFFALSNWTPIVRFLDVESRMPPAPIQPPLRILVMISDPIEYQGSLDVEREWERLQESLAELQGEGYVHLDKLERATERELRQQLRRNDYHIFHFVGHGEFNEQEEDGVLLLEDERRRTKLVTGRALGTVLRDGRSIRLVVLNNCEGARTSDADPFAGAAQSLIQKGLPAVVAMQFEITDSAAISFAREFYAGLSDNYPADAALAEGRKAIYEGATKYEIGSPVLYLSAEDGVIFNIASRPAPPPPVDPEPGVEPPAVVVPAPPAADPEVPPVEPGLPAAEPVPLVTPEAGADDAATDVAQPEPHESEPVPLVTPQAAADDAATDVAESRPVVDEPAAFVARVAGAEDAVGQVLPPAAPVDEPIATPPDVAPPAAPTRQGSPRRPGPPEASGSRKALYGVLGAVAAVVVLVVGIITIGGDSGAETTPTVLDATVAATAAPTTASSATTAATTPPTTAPTEVVQPVIADPPTPTIADPAPDNLVIDGFSDDWTSRFVFHSAHKVFGAETVDSDADLDAFWRVAWDSEFLYLFADVWDDEIVQLNTGASLWQGDEVAIYFDADLSDDAPDAVLSGDDVSFFFAPGNSENWVRLVPDGNGAAFGSAGAIVSDPGVSVTTDFDNAGYTIEARIPWRLLGVDDPQPGQEFRMTLDVSDNDAPGTSQQQALISNSEARTAAAQAFPATWEKMILWDEGMSDQPLTLPEPDEIFGQPVDTVVAMLEGLGFEVSTGSSGCSNSTPVGQVRQVTGGSDLNARIIFGKSTDTVDPATVAGLVVGDELTVWSPSENPCP